MALNVASAVSRLLRDQGITGHATGRSEVALVTQPGRQVCIAIVARIIAVRRRPPTDVQASSLGARDLRLAVYYRLSRLSTSSVTSRASNVAG